MVRSYVRKSKRGRKHRVRSHSRRKKVTKIKLKRKPVWIASDGNLFFNRFVADDYAKNRGLHIKKSYVTGKFKFVK